MRMTTKMICGLVAALMLVPATASAKTHVAVGLGDQHASTFSAPAFRAPARQEGALLHPLGRREGALGARRRG